MAVTNKQIDRLLHKPVRMTDIAGDTGVVTISYRYHDHGRVKVSYVDSTGHEGVVERSSIASLQEIKNAKGDTSFYIEYDESAGAHCVFGNNSGFAYASYAAVSSAIDKRNQMIRELANG